MARRTNLKKLPRKRYKADKSFVPRGPDVTCLSAVIGSPATDVIYTFNGPVQAIGAGLMASAIANGTAPVSVVAVTPTSVKLRYAATKTAAQAFSIGAQDPAVRTAAGGYVAATAGLLS